MLLDCSNYHWHDMPKEILLLRLLFCNSSQTFFTPSNILIAQVYSVPWFVISDIFATQIQCYQQSVCIRQRDTIERDIDHFLERWS